MKNIELLSIPIIHQHIASVVDSYLQPKGFVSLKPLQWIRSHDAPIRQLFEYRQFKGGALAPAWGWSLDFVPHFSGRELKWHRTEKSALFDVVIDGQNDNGLILSYMYGVSGLLDGMQLKVASATRIASEFWSIHAGVQDVYSIVQELRSKPRSEFYIQLPIANAFCLAKNGKELEARAELEFVINNKQRYSSTELSSNTIAKLWKVFESVLV